MLILWWGEFVVKLLVEWLINYWWIFSRHLYQINNKAHTLACTSISTANLKSGWYQGTFLDSNQKQVSKKIIDDQTNQSILQFVDNISTNRTLQNFIIQPIHGLMCNSHNKLGFLSFAVYYSCKWYQIIYFQIWLNSCSYFYATLATSSSHPKHFLHAGNYVAS